MISLNLATAVFESGVLSEPIPVSSKDNSGMVELNAAVTRTLTGGEEQTS
jgi:predicted GTPase